MDLFLLSIDEGITGYRDDSLETVKRNEQQYGIPLKVSEGTDLAVPEKFLGPAEGAELATAVACGLACGVYCSSKPMQHLQYSNAG